MSLVTAITVSYKNEKMTCDYINKELSKCPEIDHVIIVNNAATEESNQKLKDGISGANIASENDYHGGRVIILPYTSNQGFAKGNNQGVKYVHKYIHSKYILFTNDDIIINDPDVVRKLIEKKESDDSIGCIGPKILKRDGSIQGPGQYLSLWKRYFQYTAYPIAQRVMHRYLHQKRKRDDAAKKEGFTYVVIGCFFIVKTADFMEIGMMDETTFLYREEEILAEKWKKNNKSNYWLSSVSVTHLVGQSTGEGKRKSYNLVNKNTIASDLYYYHHYMGYPVWQITLVQGINKIIGKIFG